jgi:hypothetical protein
MGIDDFAHGALTMSDFAANKEPDKCPDNIMGILDTAITDKGADRDAADRADGEEEGVDDHHDAGVRGVLSQAAGDGRAHDGADDGRAEGGVLAERAFIDTTSAWPFTEQGFQRALAFRSGVLCGGGIPGERGGSDG